jgi:hypothetical protein
VHSCLPIKFYVQNIFQCLFCCSFPNQTFRSFHVSVYSLEIF